MASTRTAVVAAILGNLAIAVTKFVAAGITGSSSLLTEAVHSVVDTGNDALMLVGMRASRQPADEGHPFGHARVLYFYTLIVAVVIFGAGGVLSIYEGILHVLEPEPITDVHLTYIVLGVAAIFEGVSWFFGWKAFRAEQGSRSIWGAVRTTKDPTTFAVLLEDSAALVGLAFAALAIVLAERLHQPMIDGVGSIAIGLLLCTAGAIMLRESKDLLIGEAAPPGAVKEIRHIIEADPAVTAVARVLTMQLGPRSIMLAVDLQFAGGLSSDEVARAVDRLEERVRQVNPDVRHIFIEAEAMKASRGAPRP